MNRLFQDFPVISTDDIDEARSFISSELTEMRFKEIENASSFAFQMNGVQLDQTLVGYEVFDTTTVVDAGEVGEALVAVIGVGPASIIEIDGEPIDCSKNGVIVSPKRRMVLHRPPNGGTLFIRTTMKTVETLLHQMIARKPTKKLAFDRCFSLKNGVGLQLSRIVKHLATDIGQNTEALGNPFLNKGYESLILNSFLSLPNNLSDELIKGQNYSVAPRLVRKAEDFIYANATKPITISDVVAHCECSRRALFNTFRSFRGYTPMQFLAESRLSFARKALLAPAPTDTVTSIAYVYGFSHLGRFSAVYRKRFGENPLDTLRKAHS